MQIKFRKQTEELLKLETIERLEYIIKNTLNQRIKILAKRELKNRKPINE